MTGFHSLKGGGPVEVEKKGHIRQARINSKGIDHFRLMGRNFSAHALIDGCRIKEAVAYDDAAGGQSRGNDFANKLSAARSKKQKLGFRREILSLGGVLKEVADRLSGWRAAWFSQE